MYQPNKKLGQNFLIDTSVAQAMVENLNIKAGDIVIEIGPGLGIVTELLERLTHHINFDLYVVEIDNRFVQKLTEMFAPNPRLHIVHEDVLKFLPKFVSQKPVHIIGSLPFYITSPIIHSIIKMQKQPESAVLMIQKEVAQKIYSQVPDASYMSTFVQTFYSVSYIQTVSKNFFNPIPDVDAGIILLQKKASGIQMEFGTFKKYEGFLHKGFSNPRKMLNKVFSKEELENVGLSPDLRPQNVEVGTWINLFNNTLK